MKFSKLKTLISHRKLILIVLPLIGFGCAHSSATGDSLPNGVQAPDAVTYLQGATLIDGTGSAPIEGSILAIRNGRIESILKDASAIAKGSRVIDVQGKTIIPTLIAAHSHLGMTKDDQAGAANLNEENVKRQLQKFEDYGIGAVLSLGTDHDFIYDLRSQRGLGQISGPMILTAGHGFGLEGGAPPVAMGMDQVYRPKTVAEAKKDVEELAAHRPNIVKIWVDDFGHSMKEKMDPKIYKAIIAAAHANGLKVAAHVYYLADAKRLAADGVDVFAHSVRDQPVDKALVNLMKKNKISYIPTLALDDAFFVYASKPEWMETPFFKKALDPGVLDLMQAPKYQAKESSKKDLEIAKKNVMTLYQAGIPVGLGTDSGATLLRIQGFGEHRELELLVSAGLTPMQAIVAATKTNASILGIISVMGTLEPGKKADFVVLDGNPLSDIRNTRKINAVWMDGAEVSKGP